jgi:UDP-arabinose 4-epimerase
MDNNGPILVTGGAGYIGSHVCKALAASGYLPVAFDNLSSGHRDQVKWGPLEFGDITDRQSLAEAFLNVRPAAVIHLAAFQGDDGADPDAYYKTNVAGSVTLLRAMAEAQVANLVFCSTAEVYGMPEQLPVPEDQELDAITPFGTSQLMAERAIPDFAEAHELNWAILRVFNAAGADPDGEAGAWHNNRERLLPSAILAACGKRGSLPVFGTAYDTEDGTAIRDFVHVSDVADAHVLALSKVLAGQSGIIANIGSGVGHSVIDVIQGLERISGLMVPAREAPPRPGDPAIMIANRVLADSTLSWRPRRSSLDEILATAWQWHNREAT